MDLRKKIKTISELDEPLKFYELNGREIIELQNLFNDIDYYSRKIVELQDTITEIALNLSKQR